MQALRHKQIVVEAPASSANLGPGFDVFAIALREPRDTLRLESAHTGVSLRVKGITNIPTSPQENVAGAVAAAIMADQGVRSGISLTLAKRVPVGAGIGSSAASSVAAAVGTDSLFDLRLTPAEIIRYAGMGERLASGTAHYDNVTASYAGGFVAANGPESYFKIDARKSLELSLVTPKLKLPRQKTKYARSLLPKEITLDTVVDVERAASTMVHGFMSGDVEEIGWAMMVSPVDEARSKMIPGFKQVREAALAKGAAGVCISGAGPTVLAATERKKSSDVTKAMMKEFRSRGIRCSGFTTTVGEGCRVIEE